MEYIRVAVGKGQKGRGGDAGQTVQTPSCPSQKLRVRSKFERYSRQWSQ